MIKTRQPKPLASIILKEETFDVFLLMSTIDIILFNRILKVLTNVIRDEKEIEQYKYWK